MQICWMYRGRGPSRDGAHGRRHTDDLSGPGALTTLRNEKDRVEIQSGAELGVTLGTPIAIIV